MNPFTYHLPDTLEEAKTLLAQSDDAKLLAGGMTLFPTMKMRLAAPSDLVDLGALDTLDGISIEAESVTIGAMTTHAEVAADATLQKALPALTELANHIGDAQVRNRGTLGGSLANSDPAADYPAAALALDATLCTDHRDISAQDYFLGLFETALQEHEIIRAVTFQRPRRAAYAKFPNPASRYAVVGVFVAQMSDNSFRVAVTGASSHVYRERQYERALASRCAAESLDNITLDSTHFNEDVFASKEYRAQLVAVMAKRAVGSLA